MNRGSLPGLEPQKTQMFRIAAIIEAKPGFALSGKCGVQIRRNRLGLGS